MPNSRRFSARFRWQLAALVGTAPVVMAQGQQFFQWTGRVDREVQIIMRRNQVRRAGSARPQPNFAPGRAMSDLPRQDGVVRVQVMQGRGNVAVIQAARTHERLHARSSAFRTPAAAPTRIVSSLLEGYFYDGEYVGWPGRGRGRDRNYPDNNDVATATTATATRNPRVNGNRHDAYWSRNVDDQVEDPAFRTAE